MPDIYPKEAFNNSQKRGIFGYKNWFFVCMLLGMEKGEQHFCEVLIVGGGPAGLSCALSVARGGGLLIICDNKDPRNKNAACIRNLPGHEGMTPIEYHELLKSDLLKYENVELKYISVVDVKQEGGFFYSSLSDNTVVTSKKIVFAEGLQDILPNIAGMQTFWGRSVFHCAYCHGYENRGKELGMLATNEKAIQMLRLLRGLAPSLKVFTNGKSFYNDEEKKELEKLNITFYEGKIISLEGHNNELTGVLLKSSEIISCDTLFIQHEVKPKSEMGIKLGCQLDERGIYIVNEEGLSNIPGVYFAGDVGSHYHSVVMASAIGSHVGICVNADLMRDLFGFNNESFQPLNLHLDHLKY